MAPEQAFGEAIDLRADIYALGSTLFQLLTGQRPFEAPTPIAMIARQQTDRLPDPRDLRPSISAGAVALLQGMLSRQAESRYPTYRELLADLDRVRAGGLPARPLPPEDHRSISRPAGVLPTAPLPATLALPAPSVASAETLLHGSGPPGTRLPPTLPPGPIPGSAVPPPPAAPAPAPAPPTPAPAGAAPPPPARSRAVVIVPVVAAAALLAGFLAFRDRGRPDAAPDAGPGRAVPAPAVSSAPPAPPPADADPPDSEETLPEAYRRAREARRRDDPLAALEALEGLEGRLPARAGPRARREVAVLRAWAEAEAPEIEIRSAPPGAAITVDGTPSGTTPARLRLRAGERALRLVLAGHLPFERTVPIPRGGGAIPEFRLEAERAPDPEPAVRLERHGGPKPIWEGKGLGLWTPAGGEWRESDPGRTAWIEGAERPESAALLRGDARGADLVLARADVASIVRDAPGWILEWQMFAEKGGPGAPARMELLLSTPGADGAGPALAVGVDGEGAYLGRRGTGTGALLSRTHAMAGVDPALRHTFVVENHGDVAIVTVDGKRLGAVAVPGGLAPVVHAAVGGGAGYFSDMTLGRLRRP
jgi:hypothetical protein